MAIAGAALLVITAFLLRRLRLAAIALAAIIAWFALPHFDLLLVPAYPTSFYHSPSGFTSATITEGQALFSQNCVSCHGANGMGDGTAAKSLLIPPADLTAAHLWQHSDGELFWWISHGMTGPEGSQTMPGFADTIDEDSRWALIDYIRAHNAGTARQPRGDFPRPVQAPGFGLRCGAAKPQQLSDLRGHYVRLVIGAPPPLSNFSDITTIFTVLAPDPALCIASDETLPLAYAITSGITPSAITGTQFLIDPSGWLRALQFPATGDWNDPAKLKREIQQLQAHPVTLPTATPMKMPM